MAIPLVANFEGRPYVKTLGGAPDAGVGGTAPWAEVSLGKPAPARKRCLQSPWGSY